MANNSAKFIHNTFISRLYETMIIQLLLLLLHLFTITWNINPILVVIAAPPPMALPNCLGTCGNVQIPFPFGMGKGCYHDEWYEITCNKSTVSSPKPFLTKLNLEFASVDIENRFMTLNFPIGSMSSNCQRRSWSSPEFAGSTFRYSNNNEFTVVGCDNALLVYKGEIMAGCTSACINSTVDVTRRTQACYGIGCCQTLIPTVLDFYTIYIFISGNDTRICTYAFLAQKGWYPMKLANIGTIQETDRAPVEMDWELIPTARFMKFGGKSPRYNCFSKGKDGDYFCTCGWAYEGNPFIHNGCRVAKACATCEKQCDRLHGGELYCNLGKTREILLGTILGGVLGLLLLCGFGFWFYKFQKKRRDMKLKKAYFENKVRLLQQQISADGGTVQNTVVFTYKELVKATDNFNENRILGQGGQGTVYKGMLTDGKITAIKKSKIVEEGQLEQFINEVVILSQINHRNIVKLLGCCLETDVPLLVYEFVSNGNLSELIHDQDQNEEFPFTWKMRLQIAKEVAGALAYLHSASSTPIYHRDVKSTNILLDEKFRAKLADFGTSRSIPIEQTHLTTLVHGTFGYLDPEYFQSSQFTDKSDVYSYGVVLAELLTGQKAISSSMSDEEEKNLAARFISLMKEMRLFELVDPRVMGEARKEEIWAVAEIVKRCLNLNGKQRPAMIQVMMELERIRVSHTSPQYYVKDEFAFERNSSTSVDESSTPYRRIFTSQTDPLLINTV